MYFTFDPGLTVTVNFIFTLREPNVYKPHGFFLGFLATFICFCATVLFYRYLYFVVNQIKLKSYRVFIFRIFSICSKNLKLQCLSPWHLSLPACRRLVFPFLPACNKGNRRRLHAGNINPSSTAISDSREVGIKVLIANGWLVFIRTISAI